MEWSFLKTLKMFSYHYKFIVNICFMCLIMQMITESCWSVPVNTLNSTQEFLEKYPLPVDNPSSPKPNCEHKYFDGTVISSDCPTESFSKEPSETNLTWRNRTTYLNTSKVNSTDLIIKGLSSQNITSINTAKPIVDHIDSNMTSNFSLQNHSKNHLQPNETATTNSSKDNSTKISNISTTTENAEIASMNDHFNKYRGGLDVDEKLNTSSNALHDVGTPSKSQKLPSNVVDLKLNKTQLDNVSHLQVKASKPFFSTKAAGIAAGICVTIASFGYISLMVWKNISYNRYGNREMLLNEDDLGDIHDEDMRHFELRLLNKDGKVIES